ncbi:MAG: hypothetical protein WDO24_09870 [Pseudomonadota bacterium]
MPGERAQGLVLGRSVRDNIALPSLRRLARAWRVDDRAIDRVVLALMDALDIGRATRHVRCARCRAAISRKVVFAKWLAAKVGILLLDEPTQGVDIAAKAALHRLIRDFAARGGGVVLASADFDELLSLSDHVLAMRDGAVLARFARDDPGAAQGLRRTLGG